MSTMSGLRFRPMQQNDINAVLEIAIRAWTPVYEGYRDNLGEEIFSHYYRDWQENKRREIMQDCFGDRTNEALDSISCVVEVEAGIAGFINWMMDRKQKNAIIGNNAVDPRYQGRGIASSMYRYVLDDMRLQGMTHASVLTGGDAAHIPARSAYEKAGFHVGKPSIVYYQKL